MLRLGYGSLARVLQRTPIPTTILLLGIPPRFLAYPTASVCTILAFDGVASSQANVLALFE
jgi:hypothetical protein